jgi:hypothetical protein
VGNNGCPKCDAGRRFRAARRVCAIVTDDHYGWTRGRLGNGSRGQQQETHRRVLAVQRKCLVLKEMPRLRVRARRCAQKDAHKKAPKLGGQLRGAWRLQRGSASRQAPIRKVEH